MTIPAGEHLGPYEILSLAGSGGMGEVYRARDSRMSREVAVKVLPDSVAGNRDRLQRFEQEARAAGMLNHPNLLTIYDIGSHASSPYIVSEFLEGETLREKLNAGRSLGVNDSASPVPLRKAIDWAQQLAAGLAAAHDKGIVHRDLKPENIFITRDGRLKILDFGLAKLLDDATPSDVNDERTQKRGTDPGTVLGTAGYMAPEQVRGQAVDHRSDIFSLGAVLYEMFSGARAFRGDSTADTMSAILREDPPEVATLNPNVPPGVERIIRHCLEKSPDERFQSARDLSFDLASLSTDSSRVHAAAPARKMRIPLAAAIAAGALVVGAAGGWFAASRKPEPPQLLPRSRLLTFSGRDVAPTVSPDRRSMVFVSERDGRSRLWLKELATGGEIAITEGSDTFPRFSPDGSTVLFIRTESGVPSLFRTAVVGGTPRRILSRVSAADFTPDGRKIVYIPHEGDNVTVSSSVGIVSADGSEAKILATAPRIFGSPRVSPDGRWIALADITNGNLGATAWLMSIDGKVTKPLPLEKGSGTVSSLAWVDPGHIVYGVPESVAGYAAASTQRLVLVDIATNRTRPVISVLGGFFADAAGPGRVIFDGYMIRQNLREISLDAKSEPRWISRGNGLDRQPVFSPDGQWIAFSSNRSGNLDVWGINRQSGAVVRLTDHPAEDFDPAYTPDGKHLIWSSNRSGNFEIWIADADGTGARQLTRDGIDAENATITRDGLLAVYSSYNPRNPGVCAMPLAGGPSRLIYRGTIELPDVSPDGKWVSFHGLNRNELLVAEIATGKVYRVAVLRERTPTTSPGRSRWSPDGKAVLWIDRDENGDWSIQQQDFVPGRETIGTRMLVYRTESPSNVESFGLSPDGKYLVVAVSEELDGIYLAENLPLQ